MGKDFVRELQKEKNVDEIWMIARRKTRLEVMEKELDGRAKAIPLDLTDINSFDIIEGILRKECPQVLYLVNAAGAGRMGKVEEIDAKDHCFVLDINVRALTMVSRVCLPYMSKGSRIIQLCSGSAAAYISAISLAALPASSLTSSGVKISASVPKPKSQA